MNAQTIKKHFDFVESPKPIAVKPKIIFLKILPFPLMMLETKDDRANEQ